MQAYSADTRIIGPTRAIVASANLDTRLLTLTQRLQRTLDPAGLLEIFLEELGQDAAVRGIEFLVQPELMRAGNRRFRAGSLVGDRIGVNLGTEDQLLGRLELYCTKAPGIALAQNIERLAHCLAWPMHNALAHRWMQHLANSDPLTGIGNRLAFNRTLEREIARSGRHGSPLSLLLVDLDDFKGINDSYGHVAGDRVLQRVASHLRDCLRQDDCTFRIGGDEFAILLVESDEAAASIVAQRLSVGLKNSSSAPAIALSIGAAQWQPGMSADELQEQADQELYRSKLRA